MDEYEKMRMRSRRSAGYGKVYSCTVTWNHLPLIAYLLVEKGARNNSGRNVKIEDIPTVVMPEELRCRVTGLSMVTGPKYI